MKMGEFAATMRAFDAEKIGHLALLKAGAVALKEAKANVNGRVLKRRSGKLSGSIKLDVSGQLFQLRAGGPSTPYARIHEEGGRIFPKAGRYLTFRGSTGWATVESVLIPQRPYLRPALEMGARALRPALDALVLGAL
jgi:phage gpG-like protein